MTQSTNLQQPTPAQTLAQSAIMQTLQQLTIAFREHNADALSAIYTEDADWTNAFGITKHGCTAIVAYLRGLFADTHFAAGTLVGAPELAVRFVTNEVALVKTYLEIQGQQTGDGKTLPVRQNHSLKVLQRQVDDSWLIASEIFMDARQEKTYGNRPYSTCDHDNSTR